MERSDGICAKKIKFSNIFEEGLQKKLKHQLYMTVACLEYGLNHFLLREIKVIDANANRAMPFSRASIGMTNFDEKKYPLATIFTRGHAVLKQYLESDVSSCDLILPEDANCRKALGLLLKFLDAHDRDQGAEFLNCRDEVQEWQWTLELAQHVFSKLAINPKYKYDIIYDETLGCTCSTPETMTGERGDTSIAFDPRTLSCLAFMKTLGCEDGWHGKIDILMADVPICPVLCEPNLSEPFPPMPSSSTSQFSDTDSSINIEVKRSVFNDNDYSQIVSETMTFSFLKNKGKSNEEVTLIPTIAINKTGVQCHFYDSINDVLLQSGYSKLVSSTGKLEVSTIVLIWLTLNHQLFCTGTLQEMKRSGFHKLIDLDMYKEQVKAPCRISQDHSQMCISDNDWYTGTSGVVKFKNGIRIPVTHNVIQN